MPENKEQNDKKIHELKEKIRKAWSAENKISDEIYSLNSEAARLDEKIARKEREQEGFQRQLKKWQAELDQAAGRTCLANIPLPRTKINQFPPANWEWDR